MCDIDFEPTDEPKIRPTPRKKLEIKTDGKIPERVAKLLENKVPICIPFTYAPIINIDSYIRDMKLSGEVEKRYRELYTPPPEPVNEPKQKLGVPSDPLSVFVNMNILKSGIIRVKITVPMEPVYEYQKKGKVAPLDVRLKAAKGFGYPESFLIKMIEHHDKMKSKAKEIDEFIDNIFGKCVNAKVSKPKAKSVHESLNSKLKKPTAKKY
jgi:hypothetical protein